MTSSIRDVSNPIDSEFEGVQAVPEPHPVEQFNVPIPQAASIGTSSSNFWDGAIIDIPLPSPSEVRFPMPVQAAPSDCSATRESNRYLSGEFIGYDTGTDEFLQPSTSSLENTSNYDQAQPAQSGTTFASQNEDPIGPVPIRRRRNASVEWREYLLPDGTRYFSNLTLNIVTDVDLRDIERLDIVTRFFNGRDVEILIPPEWELWLRNGSESTTEFTPLMAWVHHGSRMVVFARPGSDPRHPMSKDVDKIESEHQYWSFVMSHPVHVMLPSESVDEAINVLTWFHTSQPQQSPHPSPPPFSQEECQEWLTQLRSFSREPLPQRSSLLTYVLSRHVYPSCCSHTCRIFSPCSHL
ncbi:hypothetical protein F5148DRAFT_742633 [Russula earlei]|uniref:Uncharacterized protein n=1 Tax=Russula earlei TaxID=71964 RepID=A0ACC0UFE8_9AGAM|nr:hypothetical protein F5148DRAFT_742633 [Russula earlei]